MNQYEYQRAKVAQCEGRVLNAACKEDPARLGRDFDAVNLDIESYDPHTGTKYENLPNFVQASVYELPFEDESFDMIVLGEFIEHCNETAVRDALLSLKRVLKNDGRLVMTYPYDDRPREVQHSADKLVVWDEKYGITSWHQSVWTDDLLLPILDQTGFDRVSVDVLCYGFCPEGRGCVLVKK